MKEPFFSARMPLPPGVNRSYQIVYVGRRARLADTPRAAAFKARAAEELALFARVDWLEVAAIREAVERKTYTPLKIEITYYFQTMWKRDLDGGDKAVIDAVFKHAQLNDNLVVALYATKQVDRQDPRVEVQISIVQE